MPNKKGGKKFKRGKKNTDYERQLILKNVKEDQEYAQVRQVLGNGRYKLFCFDGKDRMGIAAGNIKRKTRISLNDVVLTSKWDFQTNDDKCSIVHSYGEDEVQKLKRQNEFPKNIKLEEDNPFSVDDGFEFNYDMPSDEEDEEDEEVNIKKKEDSSSSSDDDINWDEI